MMSMALEAGYTALLQIDLVCDLASIYGVPFDPDDVGEVATLFGLALEIDVKGRRKGRSGDGEIGHDAEAPHGLTAKLMELEEGDVAKRIGRKLLEEAVVKNIVPVLGVGIAARWNYVGTRKIAATGAEVRPLPVRAAARPGQARPVARDRSRHAASRAPGSSRRSTATRSTRRSWRSRPSWAR